MERNNEIAAQFEAHRSHLNAVAYRMLGSRGEAEDAVQEAWLHVERSGASGVQNVGGWLTTVVSRVCLDMLRARRSRREEGEDAIPAPPVANVEGSGPEQATLLADSVGLALHVVLETLAPAERIAFVLHDMFDLAFDEIAAILGSSSAAARQLASRARRRVKGGSADSEVDITRHRHVVDAFLIATRSGDVSALLAVLDEGRRSSIPTRAVRRRSPPRLPVVRKPRNRRSSPEASGPSGHRRERLASSSTSRSAPARSSPST
jgi:RNA polymerase sigma factor (sigma-70 family)